MQIVAMLGAKVRPEAVKENLTMKHSISGSSTVSATMDIDRQLEVCVSDIVMDPLSIT